MLLCFLRKVGTNKQYVEESVSGTVVYFIEDEEVMNTEDGCLDMREEEFAVDAEHSEIENQKELCSLNVTSILKEDGSLENSAVS